VWVNGNLREKRRVRSPRVVVIGAGMGGLAAALILSARGLSVTVLERAAQPGGKLRTVAVGASLVDAGPTVFTMPDVLRSVFEQAGETLSDHLTLRPVDTLARHAWSADERLDLFADVARSADAIGAFAGAAEARGFLDFCSRAQRIHDTLDRPFMRRPAPSMAGLVRGAPLRDLFGISPFTTLWQALGTHFRDPRLQQLFGRYATYCGSSPFAAPATLMLVAHVERSGVWLVEGGMHRIASVTAALAEARGATIRTGAEVEEILVSDGQCRGVRLAGGERIEAEAVLCNADVAALAGELFGSAARRAVDTSPARRRSLSALTWALEAETGNFPLLRHTVFFSRDYPAEFADLRAGRLPQAPTIYVCAQDRDDAGLRDGPNPAGPERLFLIVNAPAGDHRPFPTDAEIHRCQTSTFSELRRCGLLVSHRPELTQITAPAQFAQMFPATGGGLYGQASHGWRASFRRPGVRSRLPGLFLAGGSTHPGPGLSMAALSGQMAAGAILQDLASTSRSVSMAIAGGMSTRSATTGATASP